ncbi:hypothetical protein DVA43_00755 [Leclercia sp. W6]|uniref:hypothetical protein n=1 Tax=Leclercia sp. W6 TaxID=2282310 RepID=UPI000DF47D14|nr:hypothetical protein [Leclercia sp. W6]AXF58192.1 hypothetical protein DVA43_00755 [Leclercia sp. W6]
MSDIAVYRNEADNCVVMKDGEKVFTFTPEQWSVICMAANADMENRLYALIHGETLRLERERKWKENREKVLNRNG